MYIDIKGMGRRGLGEVTYDAEGMPVEDPANTTWGARSGGAYPLPVVQVAVGSPQTLTAWLNANSTIITVGAVVFVGALFFAKVGR